MVRSVLDAAGVSNVLSKSFGVQKCRNVAKATLQALKQLKLKKDIYAKRGMEVRPTPSAASVAETVEPAVETSTEQA